MKSTKKSLLLSAISLLLCFTMLLGTTFAWFTDEVTSGTNRIVAGNLDVEMFFKNAKAPDWKNVKSEPDADPKFFLDANGKEILWEPGVVAYTNFKVENVGNLALKYSFKTLAKAFNTVDGTKSLRDVIKFAIVDGSQSYATREDAITAGTTAGFNDMESFEFVGSLEANAATHPTKEFTVIAYWQPNVLEDNDYNLKNGKKADDNSAQLYINLEIKLVATQDTVESDSFDEKYDITAPWTGEVADAVPVDSENENVYLVSNGAELAKIAAMVNGGNDMNGKTVKLVKDIDLNNVDWTPIGNDKAFNGVFDGDNHTILNLKASGNEGVGLFGKLFNYGTVKNLTVKNAKVSGVNYVGVIAGAVYGNIENCKVETATVTANAVNGKEGAKAGSIVGYLREGSSMKITGCSAKNVTINGYRDLGGIVGAVYGDNTVTGNTCEGVIINQSDLIGYNDGNTDLIGAIYGRVVYGENNIYSGGTLEQESTGVTINKAPKPIVVPEGKTAQAAVTAAVSTAQEGDILILPSSEDTITLPSIPANITIKGDGNTKVVLANNVYGASAAAITEGATLENIVLDCGDSLYHGFHHSGPIEFKDCKINGKLTLYGPTVFTNCTINTTTAAGADYIWTYGCDVTFDGCTFNTTGKALLCYNEANGSGCNNVTVKNCTFNATAGAKAGAIANQNCAAIEIDNYGCGVNLTLSNNTVQTGANAFSGEWRIKSYYPESANDRIFVNEVEYTSIALDGKTMTIDESKNVTVNS